MYKAACTNVQIVDICWFYQRCIHSPAGEQTAPAPRRYFLGEAGNEAPCRTQADPERPLYSQYRVELRSVGNVNKATTL